MSPPMPYAFQVAGGNCIGPRAPASLALRTRPKADSTKLIDARIVQGTPKRRSAALSDGAARPPARPRRPARAGCSPASAGSRRAGAYAATRVARLPADVGGKPR